MLAAETWSPENRTQLIVTVSRRTAGRSTRDRASGPRRPGVLPSGTKSRRPVVPTRSRIWSTLVTPGISTTIRSLPCTTTSGSVTPDLSIRLRTIWRMTARSSRDWAPCPRRGAPGTRSAGRPGGRGRASSRGCGPRAVPRRRQGHGHKAQHEGEQANDDDQDRGGATHRGGMIQGTADPRGADRRAATRPVYGSPVPDAGSGHHASWAARSAAPIRPPAAVLP